MFIHDPDLVPFNVLPNFNIFKRYEWCYERGITVTVGTIFQIYKCVSASC